MKHILLPIVLLTLLVPSIALGVTMDDLVKREGLYYKKFSDVPYTGRTAGEQQGSFKNGVRIGSWATFWSNGQLWERGTFKNGKKDGSWSIYYDNGQLWQRGSFKSGKKDGSWILYYDSGQLLIKSTYKDGKANGYWHHYNIDGSKDLGLSGTYKDGKKISD